MLKARATKNHGGVIISGTGEDLEELYSALNTLMENRDGSHEGEVPESGTNLRISSLCYDIRHAFPVPTQALPEGSVEPGAMYGPMGEAGRILSFSTGKELPFDLSLEDEDGGDDGLEELEGLEELDGPPGLDEDYIDAGVLDEAYDDLDELEAADEDDGVDPLSLNGAGIHYEPGELTGLPLQAVCEFRIMWPELIFVCLVLRDYLGSHYALGYDKKMKGLDWTTDWVAIRRFQIVVLDLLCQHASPAQARSIRKIFVDSHHSLDGYCTQYVDTLGYTFAIKGAEQRLKLLPQLPKKMVAQGSEYLAIETEIRKESRRLGCQPWELRLVEEIPEDFDW